MEKKQNKYSIRKFTFGASSILIGSLLFLGAGSAQAAEESNTQEAATQQLKGNQLGDNQKENLGNEQATPVKNDNTQTNGEENATNASLHNEQSVKSQTNANAIEVDPGYNEKDKAQKAEIDPGYNAKDKAQKTEVDPGYNAKDKAKKAEIDPGYNAKDKAQKTEVDPGYNAKDKAQKTEVDPGYNAKDKAQKAEIDPGYNEKDKVQKTEIDPGYNAKDKAQKTEIDPGYNAKDKAQKTEIDPGYNAKDKTQKTEVDPGYNAKDKAQKTEVDPGYNEKDKAQKAEIDPGYNAKDKAQKAEVDPGYNAKDKAQKAEVDPGYNAKDKAQKAEIDPEYNAKDKAQKAEVDPEYNQAAKNKVTAEKQDKTTVSLDKLKDETLDTNSKTDKERKQNPEKTLKTLKENAVATPNQQTKQTAERTADQPNKKAKQSQYKNQDPIILVHGFNGFTDDNNPAVLSHYWGGDKLDIRQDLESNGYEAYEASIGALSSNYDRAVELYYYIKGGRVDYGAAHAAKSGHDRYGKTYEGVYKDWQPGQKVHLVAHSMGGQTVRQLEELLRNGNKEEIEYQKAHGGEISPLYQGKSDNMINSITTLGTPHNGTIAADKLGNEALVRQLAFDYAKFKGNKNSKVDFGFGQWGLKQREGESYAKYVQRVQNSKIWKSQDNGFYDLTREGAAKLNKNTSLNPNIVYKTYTGESTRPTLLGKQKSDINMFFPFTVTGNVIGKAAEKEWRENDGLISTISAQHPFNQAHTEATDQVQKGIWQVTPIRHGWDHVDFVGQDATDSNHPTEELQQFWHGIAEDLVRNEQFDK